VEVAGWNQGRGGRRGPSRSNTVNRPCELRRKAQRDGDGDGGAAAAPSERGPSQPRGSHARRGAHLVTPGRGNVQHLVQGRLGVQVWLGRGQLPSDVRSRGRASAAQGSARCGRGAPGGAGGHSWAQYVRYEKSAGTRRAAEAPPVTPATTSAQSMAGSVPPCCSHAPAQTDWIGASVSRHGCAEARGRPTGALRP
jgi:hypothetical protein